ncbi:MAG TPA: roadblock/LC7 domain-containing protein [Micromonosporaceae bacterium]|nr:roadblock/LC7 domain-containing protein [Micromonosporaceae bacterium]
MTGPFAYGVGDFADDGRRGVRYAEGDHAYEGRNGHPASALSPDAEAFTWQLDTFTSTTVGVLGAVAVSSDGLLVAASSIKDRANADRLAAVVSGMTSLATGAAHSYALGMLNRVVVDMSDGYLLISALGSGSVLGVVAERSTDLATAAYEMTLFATRAGSRLTPSLIIELRAAIPH